MKLVLYITTTRIVIRLCLAPEFTSPVLKGYNLIFLNGSFIDHIPNQCTQGRSRLLIFLVLEKKKERGGRRRGKGEGRRRGRRRSEKILHYTQSKLMVPIPGTQRESPEKS